jgi:DNA-binding MarR family transcriptional regulator
MHGSTTSRTLDVWARLVRGQSAMRRSLSADLQVDHGLTVNQYAALLLLSQAETHHVRVADLADWLDLSRSFASRLLDSLQEQGLVARRNSQHDGRVTYAVLTQAGRRKLERASRSHRATIQAILTKRYTDHDLDTLIELLGRVAGPIDH